MPTIRELFNKDVKGLTKGLYEGSKIYIESQGAINPPRLKALALASPNSIADLVGITAAAVAGIPVGYANRPSDTVFNTPGPFQKPVMGLLGPLLGRYVIRPKKSYYIKQTPAPYQVVNQIKNGIKTNPLGTLLTAARNELRDGTLREIFAKKSNVIDKYGTQYQHLATRSTPLATDKLFSEYYPVYGTVGEEYQAKLKDAKSKIAQGINPKDKNALAKYQKRVKKFKEKNKPFAAERGIPAGQIALEQRKNHRVSTTGVSKWDQINDDILIGRYPNISELNKVNTGVNVPYVAFEIYETKEFIILPGTITGLSEDLEPSWNTYKYVGSPFNTYRYSGVERSVKFDLKLYANEEKSLTQLKTTLLSLRELVFPNENVNEITTGGASVLTGFNPNLVYFTISGYYKKLLGFVDGMSISVDDDVPWPTTSGNFEGVDNPPHPAVIMVSFSIKIIENTKYDKSTKTLVYNFQEIDDEPPPAGTKLPQPKIPSLSGPDWS